MCGRVSLDASLSVGLGTLSVSPLSQAGQQFYGPTENLEIAVWRSHES